MSDRLVPSTFSLLKYENPFLVRDPSAEKRKVYISRHECHRALFYHSTTLIIQLFGFSKHYNYLDFIDD